MKNTVEQPSSEWTKPTDRPPLSTTLEARTASRMDWHIGESKLRSCRESWQNAGRKTNSTCASTALPQHIPRNSKSHTRSSLSWKIQRADASASSGIGQGRFQTPGPLQVQGRQKKHQACRNLVLLRFRQCFWRSWGQTIWVVTTET